jgi:hypothetical protein
MTRYEQEYGSGDMLEDPEGEWVQYAEVKEILKDNLYRMEVLQSQVEELLCLVEATTGVK